MPLKTSILALFLLIPAVLQGCADKEKNLVALCNSYASALTSLATLRAAGDLSQSDIQAVDAVREEVNPICEDGEYFDLNQAINAVQDAVFKLQKMRAANVTMGGDHV